MSLNIKDPEVHRLARVIARATGKSMTSVVAEALQAQALVLDQRRGRASVEDLLAIADRTAVFVRRPYADHADLLYDESGLPA